MGSYYPDNTSPNDKTAPWNQESFESKSINECVECDCERRVNKNGYCEDCFNELQDDEMIKDDKIWKENI